MAAAKKTRYHILACCEIADILSAHEGLLEEART